MLISIVICTYNRSNILEILLNSIKELDYDLNDFEVIVVDNNSSDNTKKVVEKFSTRQKNIKYLFEEEVGLSNARNTGWNNSNGLYIAYIDDDCKVPKKWLKVAKDVIDKFSPGMFGGPYYPYYISKKPHWFKDSYGTSKHAEQSGIMKEGQYISGGNFFIKKSLLKDLGGFNPCYGMKGSEMGYGEETELIRIFRRKYTNQDVYYEEKLLLYHLVRREKMSILWNIKQRFISGKIGHQIFEKDSHSNITLMKNTKLLIRTIYYILKDIINSINRDDKTTYPCIQNYFFEITINHFYSLGTICARYKNYFRPIKLF